MCAYNDKHSLRSNTKGYQLLLVAESCTICSSHSRQVASLETFGYTLIYYIQ